MSAFQIGLLASLFIIGYIMGWCEIQAFRNCQQGKKGTMLSIRWLFSPGIFNEKGNRYRRAYIMLYIPAMVVFVLLCIVSTSHK